MYLGFDTSNYTTSFAVFDGERIIVNNKKLLTVKDGERGLRQSDAVFQHTLNMPELIEDSNCNDFKIDAVAVSSRPRNVEGSYMPCFLVGINNAVCAAKVTNANLYYTSHQIGHILAALYSADQLELIYQRFIAFHVSGGTTEALLIEPDKNDIIKATVIAQSSDLKAGQAVDRAGVMLGLGFPCGRELDSLSLESKREFKHKISMNGLNCSLSGIENKAHKMFDNNESREDIAKFVITYICDTLDRMTELILQKYGNLPLIFAGGVMSNTIIKEKLTEKYNAYFAQPQFSCDNACGTAIYAYLKDRK